MKRIFCDMCGKEITDLRTDYAEINIVSCVLPRIQYVDLCIQCTKKAVDAIDTVKGEKP